MNGFRVVRKYVERLSEEDLKGLHEAAKKDDTQEAVVVAHIIECEMAERKEQITKEITRGVRELGAVGSITTKHVAINRFAVYLDGDYFGIWDTVRKTFVD